MIVAAALDSDFDSVAVVAMFVAATAKVLAAVLRALAVTVPLSLLFYSILGPVLLLL